MGNPARLASNVVPAAIANGTTAYATGQSIGVPVKIDHVFREPQTNKLDSITLQVQEKIDGVLDVVFFGGKPTAAYADQTTFAPSNADLALILGTVSIKATDYTDFNANTVATKALLQLRLKNLDASQADAAGNLTPNYYIYVALVARGAITYTGANHLNLLLGVDMD